jgi:hypothetical protein
MGVRAVTPGPVGGKVFHWMGLILNNVKVRVVIILMQGVGETAANLLPLIAI